MKNDGCNGIPLKLEPYFNKDSQFHYYCESQGFVKDYRDIDNKFICLKGFSSSTPIVHSAAFNMECRGGGFFFRYNGCGIVVDPGIGFVSLMHQNNIFIDDIDIVIVTHNHIDHNNDVRSLSALLHEFNRDKTRSLKFYKKIKCEFEEPKEHKIKWIMDAETIVSNRDIMGNQTVQDLSRLTQWEAIDNDGNIELMSINTEHIKSNDDTYKNNTYGIKLKFKDERNSPVWGYTSDTRFFDKLIGLYDDTDVILFNISDIYAKDVQKIKQKNNHLGFNGSLKLLSGVKAKLALATEFCCVNGDCRHEIVLELKKELEKVNSNNKMRIVPAESGLRISISGEQVNCSICKKLNDINLVKACRPEREYEQIKYICEDCLL